MKRQSKIFLSGKTEKIEQVAVGIKRQILAYNDDIMLVKAWFDDDSIGYVHNHVHSQVTYVESGEFEVNVGGEIQILEAGDSFCIPPDVSHGATCKKAGVLVDVFSPCREDFFDDEEK